MNTAYHLKPAFGKSYETEAEVRRDWENGVDFAIINGGYSYMNSRDFEKYCQIRLDTVLYCWKGLTVYLNTGII